MRISPFCHGRSSSPTITRPSRLPPSRQPPLPRQSHLPPRQSPVIIRLLPLFGLAACLAIGVSRILHLGALPCDVVRLEVEPLRVRHGVWCAGCSSHWCQRHAIGPCAGNRGLVGPVWLHGWSGRRRGATDGVATGVVVSAIGRCAGDRGLGRRCGSTDRAAAVAVMCVVREVCRAISAPMNAAGDRLEQNRTEPNRAKQNNRTELNRAEQCSAPHLCAFRAS